MTSSQLNQSWKREKPQLLYKEYLDVEIKDKEGWKVIKTIKESKCDTQTFLFTISQTPLRQNRNWKNILNRLGLENECKYLKCKHYIKSKKCLKIS